jgi:hypothetical protein
MKNLFFLVLITPMIIGSCAQEEKTPIEGVWKITESSYTSPDTSWIRNSPQPSLWFFGKEYYSLMYITGDKPRPLQPEGSTRTTMTDEQFRSNYMNYYANAGQYELDGSKLITHPTVALSPNFMTGGSWEIEYKIEGNTLWFTRTDNNNVIVDKLILLER